MRCLSCCSHFSPVSALRGVAAAINRLPICPKLRYIHTTARDILSSVSHLVSNLVRWQWRTRIVKSIIPHKLETGAGKARRVASLFSHRLSGEQGTHKAVLFLHGDQGHPFNLLHLSDRAVKVTVQSVFSLHLPYDDIQPEMHRRLFKSAIQKIHSFRPHERLFLKIVSHSRGGMEACHQITIERDIRIGALLAIAGRFKVTTCNRAPRPTLELSVRVVEKGLAQAKAEERIFPLWTITAGKDQDIPYEASNPWPFQGRHVHIEEARHLNVVFHPRTASALDSFLSYEPHSSN